MQLGNEAAQALQNPVFQVVYDHLSRKYYSEWVALPGEHVKEAASLKARHLALQDVYRDLTSLVAQAEKLIAEQRYRNSPEGKEAARVNNLGFIDPGAQRSQTP